LRSGDGLRRAVELLAAVPTDAHRRTDEGRLLAVPQVAEWETTNVHQVATVLTAAALEREESRGGHARSDFPETEKAWQVRLELALDADGVLVSRRAQVG
jgi:L-aspartate oxidase